MTERKPLWHGISLVAGGAIGAGIFALPSAVSGAWMTWATFGFVLVWLMTYVAASLLASVNLAIVKDPSSHLDSTSSFNSLVHFTLGEQWARLNNISIAFIMIILMYAYTTAGASILSYSLESVGFAIDDSQRGWLSLIFAFCTAILVSVGTSVVSRITLTLMSAMLILFVLVSIDLVPNIQVSSLLEPNNTFPYLTTAIPVLVTAFACGGLVPSLVRHYPNQQENVFKSLFWGTFLVLMIYLFWLVITLGTVERAVYLEIGLQGGDIRSLVKALIDTGSSDTIQLQMTLFSHFAIITSFLSVGLGFLHFLQDKLSLNRNINQRIRATIYCFSPPAVASFFFPFGFVYAIGLAGLFVSFSFFILPSLMAFSIKQKLNGDRLLIMIVGTALFGTLVFVLKSLSLLNFLPIP